MLVCHDSGSDEGTKARRGSEGQFIQVVAAASLEKELLKSVAVGPLSREPTAIKYLIFPSLTAEVGHVLDLLFKITGRSPLAG